MNKNIYQLSVFALVAFVGLTSCGQSTRESKLEDARIAMDNRDFSKAILLTEELLDKNGDGKFDKDQDTLTTDDVEAAHLSASARFGRAGIDLTGMLSLAKNTGVGKANEKTSEKTSDCMTDKDFKTVSNMLPIILTNLHLTDLDLGLNIVDSIILNNLVTNPAQLKNENLLKAVGNAARVVVAIIVATDTNEDNIPDKVPLAGTAFDRLVNTVLDSFAYTLDALGKAGILNSHLLKAITNLRTNSTGNPSTIIVNGNNLRTYLNGVVAECKKP